MKHLWLVGVTATAIAVIGPANGPAYAVPPPIPYSWTGCYIGGNVGLGWGSKEFQHPPSININDGIFGGFGGGQVGCDYQVAPHLVIGALGHFDAADISGSATEGSTQYSATVQSLFGAGGRVGYVNGGLLVYVDGGAAWAGDKYSVMTTLSTYTSSETRAGAFVGVGTEYYLWPNVSVFGAFNHYFFGNSDATLNCTGGVCNVDTRTPRTFSIAQDINEFRFGVNVRFSSWMMPAPPPPP